MSGLPHPEHGPGGGATYLPLLDVVPQILKLMEAQFPCAVVLQGIGSRVKGQTQVEEESEAYRLKGYVHHSNHAPAGLNTEAVSLQVRI